MVGARRRHHEVRRSRAAAPAAPRSALPDAANLAGARRVPTDRCCYGERLAKRTADRTPWPGAARPWACSPACSWASRSTTPRPTLDPWGRRRRATASWASRSAPRVARSVRGPRTSSHRTPIPRTTPRSRAAGTRARSRDTARWPRSAAPGTRCARARAGGGRSSARRARAARRSARARRSTAAARRRSSPHRSPARRSRGARNARCPDRAARRSSAPTARPRLDTRA